MESYYPIGFKMYFQGTLSFFLKNRATLYHAIRMLRQEMLFLFLFFVFHGSFLHFSLMKSGEKNHVFLTHPLYLLFHPSKLKKQLF